MRYTSGGRLGLDEDIRWRLTWPRLTSSCRCASVPVFCAAAGSSACLLSASRTTSSCTQTLALKLNLTLSSARTP